jgi:AbrB family looped-hinge helix DNA binding protein
MHPGKIQTRGQVTLPRAIRQRAGIKPGDVVLFEVIGPGRVEMRTLPRLTLAEALEKYTVSGQVDDAHDRALWQGRAAEDVVGD